MGTSSSKQSANSRQDGEGQPMRQYDVTLGDSMSIQPKVALKMSMGKAAQEKSIRFVQPTPAAADPSVIEKLETEAPEGPSNSVEPNQVTSKDGTVCVWVKKSATEVEFLDSVSRKVLAFFDLQGGPAEGTGRLYVSERLVGTDFFDLVGTLMATWMASASTSSGASQSAVAGAETSSAGMAGDTSAGESSAQAQAPPPVPTVRIVQSN